MTKREPLESTQKQGREHGGGSGTSRWALEWNEQGSRSETMRRRSTTYESREKGTARGHMKKVVRRKHVGGGVSLSELKRTRKAAEVTHTRAKYMNVTPKHRTKTTPFMERRKILDMQNL